MTSRFINPKPQFLDSAGDPVVGGEVNFYENGTTILKNTYADVNKTAASLNANPLELTADGRVPNCFYDGTARVVITSDAGQLFDVDNVGDASSGAAFDVWNSVVEYEDGALVEASDGKYYRSLQANNVGNDPTSSPTFWEQVSFIRAWNANITYALGDGAVEGSDGKLYRSLQNSNLNKDPTTEPTWWGVNNPFDQDLNTTDSPTFAALTITSFAANWTNAGRTIADLGIVTTADINGGTIDGSVIGGGTPAAISGTTGTYSGRIKANEFFSLGTPSELTIATGAITVDSSSHIVDTEGDAATDDLTTINGGGQGDILVLTQANNGRDVTVKHGAIKLAGGVDFAFGNVFAQLVLIEVGGGWAELSRSANGA